MSEYVVYEVTCKDEAITDKYLGYTSNYESLIERLPVNPTQYMKYHGGLDNWSITKLNVFSSREEAEQEKKKLLEMNGAVYTLNTTKRPLSTKVVDYLVYEIVSPNSLYSYIGHTTEPHKVFLKPDQVLKPLFGFHGTREECDTKISKYIRNHLKTPMIQEENVMTIYQIYCLDPTITMSYVGKSTQYYSSRIRGHIDSSCMEDRRVYSYMREHGWWKNWDIKPLGHYLCGGDDGNRLEWFWWKKLGAKLNTQTPGKDVVDRDKSKMKLSEGELFKVYEKFEERINREYTGSEPPPTFSKSKTVFLLDIGESEHDLLTDLRMKRVRVPKESRYEKYIYKQAVIQIFSEPGDYVPFDYTVGSLYIVTNEHDAESYLGFTDQREYTQETCTLEHNHCVNLLTSAQRGKLVYMYMSSKGGGVQNWKWNFITNRCLHTDYIKLASYFTLNNLRHNTLKNVF